MSDFNPLEVEICALRAELAKANCALADARHLLKEHAARGTASARESLKSFRERVVEMLGPNAKHEDLYFLELGFQVLDTHLADVHRACAERKCLCEALEDTDQVLAQARAAQEKAEQLERGFLDSTDPSRPRGKVISLGSRLKPPRVYVQSPGEPLHPDPEGAA